MRRAGILPDHPAFNCKKCRGRSRAAWVQNYSDFFLICDRCERLTIAPRSLHDHILEVLNADDRRKEYSHRKR